MSIEDRLSALETRLRAAEDQLRAAHDQLEIIRLLNTYGPAVDSGASRPAAQLWVEAGTYDIGGGGRVTGHDQIAAIYDSEGHQGLIHQGVSHLTATPRITVNGDNAEAVAYSFVVLKRDSEWYFWRAAANHWSLVRTPQGWRIAERYNRVLDGSDASHETLRRALR
jgi:hypothetical protein